MVVSKMATDIIPPLLCRAEHETNAAENFKLPPVGWRAGGGGPIQRDRQDPTVLYYAPVQLGRLDVLAQGQEFRTEHERMSVATHRKSNSPESDKMTDCNKMRHGMSAAQMERLDWI